jgi:DNA-binding response OmpR family regulator/class 3 adenylate cyclase/predicted ATPase
MSMPQRHVLIVAQEIELRGRLARVLQSAGHVVELAGSRTRALELAASKKIEAAIVVHSDELNGLGQELRELVPRTIMLGDRKNEIRRSKHPPLGPEAPAQEFDEQKLLDQLKEPIALPGGAGDETCVRHPVLTIEDCRLDLAAHVFVDGNGREVPLSHTELKLLAVFTRSPRQVLSRDQLRRAVVGRGAGSADRSIDMLVARLRRKIEPNPQAPRLIVSVAGVGYKFAVRPQVADRGNPPATIDQLNPSGLRNDTRATSPGQGIPAQDSEPERRHLTILSCKLVGAAVLATTLDPEDFGNIVRSFQNVCTSVVTQWNGSITHSMGDEILASFGYPTSHEDDAERAVYAALDLVERAGGLLSPSGKALQVRSAIATGLIFINENRTPVGEAIVVAGQLRTITPPNSVTVSARTRKLLGRVFVCDGPQQCELEGVSEPVIWYRVAGKGTMQSRFESKRYEKLTQFVGRQYELQHLSTVWEGAKSGKGQVVLLCGEAGIGKSRICKAWLDSIATEPHITLCLQCSPYHVNSPFHPVIKHLEHAAGFERDDCPDLKLQKLEKLLCQTGATTLANSPLFATLLSIPSEGAFSSPNLTPQRQRDLTIAALRQQLLAMALTRPVILKVADIHWADSSTLELLDRCIASVKTAHVVVVCTFRPEFFPRWLNESHVTTVHLDRLSREQTDLMISDLVGSKELPFGAREQIISKADGIPLFVEELTKAVLESGLLGVINQHDVMRNVSSSCVIPTTLLGSLTARFDKLGPSKEIAQIGAVIGREFSYRLLTEVASSDEHSLQAALSQLIACQLILVRGEPPSSAYIFKHALVQEAAYVTMLRSKRQQLHSRIADALIVGFPETVEKQPELIAHHLAEAGLAERAIEYLQKAGRRAIERSANTEAIGQLTRARELLQSLPSGVEGGRAALGLEVMLGQAMIADRGYAATETRETLLRAKMLINDSTNPSHKFAVLYGVWACLYVGGEVSKQLDAATEFLSEAERQSDTGVLCIAHRILGTTYVTTGEFARGLHQLERAQALYASEHHLHYRHQYGQDIGAATLCYLSWALWHLGYVDQASAVAADAVKHAEELSHPHTLVYTLCHARGFMDLFRQHHEDIQSYTGLVNSLCTENRFSHWINCGRVLEGWAEVCQGNVDQGIALLRTGMAAWQKAGAHLWLPMFLTLEAKACAKSGRAEAALEAIEKAIAISKDTGERWMMPEVLRVKARLLQATGRAEAGQIETILCHSLKIARAQRARCWELRASCDLARLWQGQNRIEEALQVLQSIYDQFTEGFDKPDLRNAKALVENLRRSAGLKAGDGAGKKSDETKRRKSFLLSADRDNATGNP